MTVQQILAEFLNDHRADYLSFAECRALIRAESGKDATAEQVSESLTNLIAIGKVEIVATDRSFGPGFQWRKLQ